jgi:drug/metabolite transporter (DMT)-like permease
MSLQAYFLYALSVLIWGSTWIAIKFQLGEIDPMVSVIYRFGISSALLFAWCVLMRARIRLKPAEHLFVALQGACLYGINVWLTYWSEVYLTGGVVATVFALTVLANSLNAALFLRRPMIPAVLAGGVLGLCGVALLFWPEIGRLGSAEGAVGGLLLALLATYCASIGNIIATRNTTFGLPVISINAWGMFYGTLLLLVVGLFKGVEFGFPQRPSFTIALLYLAVFGSIIAFGMYVRLLALIGPGRAGYTSMMIPLVALLISTLFEGYRWTVPAVAGVVLIVAGNLLAMRRTEAPG